MSRIVHIGYPKTATTFLQKEVFPFVEGKNYVDYYSCHDIFPDMLYLDELDYNESKVISKLNEYDATSQSLFSYEALTGAPFMFKGLNRSALPERLKSVGFDKIIITIRDQISIIDSLYRQYVVQGGPMSFKRFLDLENIYDPYLKAFNLNYLKFDRLIKRYIDVFGKENVLVLSHEKLLNNKSEYIEQIEKFVDLKITQNPKTTKSNPSLTNLSVNILRRLNLFSYNSFRLQSVFSKRFSSRNLWKLFLVIIDPFLFKFLSSKKTFLTTAQKEYLLEFYTESNQKLAELVECQWTNSYHD